MEWPFNPMHIHQVTLTPLPHKLTIILSDDRRIEVPFSSREEAEVACENLIRYGKKHLVRVRISGYGDIELD